MAQSTSVLWKTLWKTNGTEREYKFDINGKIYGPDVEVSHSVDGGLYEQFGIGNAATAKLTMSLFADDIPRAATIKRFIRLRNGEQVSEWLPKGVFFANRRSEDDGYWTIEAYDAMRKADVIWVPDPHSGMGFPMGAPAAVKRFARIMGVEVDPRTVLNLDYWIDYPANDWTIRDELCFIAAGHCGNWIMTDEGKLLLIPLLSIPPETNYLVTEYGSAITLGGVKILV